MFVLLIVVKLVMDTINSLWPSDAMWWHRTQECGKLIFWSTRTKTSVPYMFYSKFYSPSSKCTRIGERAGERQFPSLEQATLSQVMACCLTAPSHYLDQYWSIIGGDRWQSHEGGFTRETSAISHTKIRLKIIICLNSIQISNALNPKLRGYV